MKNSTQITFAFQDTSEPGENPGVGVRIKSLKKGPDEKESTEGTGESQSPVDKQPEKPVDPGLFDDTIANPAGEDQVLSETEGQTSAELESKAQSQSEDQIQTQAEAQFNPNSENLPQASIENNNAIQESANLAEYDNASINVREQNEEDADLPVFRGSSLSAEFSALQGDEIKDHGSENNEIESQEVDEQDNTGSGSEKASKSTRGRKSLKTIDEGTELINIPPDEVLFQKQYYAIGEVAEMFHVNQSLLRFWETEFDIIQPRKNRKGDRHFRPIDIKNLLLIHDLLRRRKLTIEGAKDFLKKNKRSPERFAMIQSLQKIKGFILEIKATL